MPAANIPPAPRRLMRALMAMHSAGYRGAQLVAISQARALGRRHDLVIAIGTPLRVAFAEGAGR